MKILLLRSIFNKTSYCSYCKKASNNQFSKTVILPQTKFPLRLDAQKLTDRDRIYNFGKTLYSWQRKNLNGPEFVLHDGPPYANGVPHMGHAINKILKDTVVRTKILEGRKVHYVPGWDCHGLPIELKAITNAKKQLTPLEIRKIARNFASQTIEKQKAAFESWGVIGDYENTYKTFNKNYIKNEFRQFYKLYEKKLVFRDVKPVYWSPSSRTALAEAELEYNTNHKSTAATIRFRLTKVPAELAEYKNLYVCIWTTTPWTLPSNQAVCYNQDLTYSLLQEEGGEDVYIIASELIESHCKKLNKKFVVLLNFPGSVLSSAEYLHPIYKNSLPLLHSDHASVKKGTGLVHTAPAHGPDDFLVALNHNLKIKCMVDEDGKYLPEAGAHLEGLEVLNGGTQKVLNMLKDDVLHVEDFIHSYPYDWRTGKPVILRASKQWFVDTNAIKERAVELLDDIEIIPKRNSEIYKHNLSAQLTKRPYWCISRQRRWGVPIPVFYHKEVPLLNSNIVDHLCDLLELDDDFWWSLPMEQLLPDKLCNELNISRDDVVKGEDIFDIWFDSGISWSSVLENLQIADMYLEGVDQFTGWFQSALITSVALRDKAPYKSVYVHGFALDENGLKMSKSLGNVINPDEITIGNKKQKPYGVDALRWWVSCHANQDAMANISKNVLQASADEVQKLRSILRFVLGCLNDYRVNEGEYSSLQCIDKYMLHLLHNFHHQSKTYLQNHQFNKLCKSVLNLVTNEISGLYFTSIKDRVYCEEVSSESRKNAQFVLYQMYLILTHSIAPIVPHLAEELHHHSLQKSTHSFFQEKQLEIPMEYSNPNVATLMNAILDIRRDLNKMGLNTNEHDVQIALSRIIFDLIDDCSKFEEELVNVFQVSSVHLHKTESSTEILGVEKSRRFNCGRCRRFQAQVAGDICERCKIVVDSLLIKTAAKN